MAVNIHVIKCTVDPSSAPDMVGQHWINTTNGCHWLSNGTATVANWIKIDNNEAVVSVTVAASSSEDLSTTLLTAMCSQRYQICMYNSTEDRWKSLQLFGSKKTSTTVEDSVYSVAGDLSLDVDLDYKVVGSDAVLEATNNETFPVTVEYRIETI